MPEYGFKATIWLIAATPLRTAAWSNVIIVHIRMSPECQDRAKTLLRHRILKTPKLGGRNEKYLHMYTWKE